MATRPRRLSAILHADLSGFVRLTEDAEDLTFEHLNSARSDVWRPAIEGGGGWLVHGSGDSMLVEFASAMAAIATAIDIQERMALFNEPLLEEQRLLFRIGVHMGEVIVDEANHDLFGDGVNLAERIQVMADPGGIAVSRAVRDIVDLPKDYAFVDGGEHRAKHVSRALHIFHVRSRQPSLETTTSVLPQGKLRFQGTDQAGRRVAFSVAMDELLKTREGLVVGRDMDHSDVVVAHPTVSRRHARLRFADNVLQIEDLGSTNGTAVNGGAVKADTAHALHPGDRLRLGDVDLEVRYG
jgi:class 3 adenylate cyclase